MKVLFHVPLLEFGGIYRRANKSWFEVEKGNLQIDYYFTLWQPTEAREIDINYENLSCKLNRAREVVLKNGYDYLFTVDQDLIVPRNVLLKLISDNLPVVSGLFRLRRVPNREIQPLNGMIYDEKIGRERFLEKEDIKEELQEVSFFSVGGCLLIKREILERIQFKPIDMEVNFSIDIKNLGIKPIIDTTVRCVHIFKTGQKVKV